MTELKYQSWFCINYETNKEKIIDKFIDPTKLQEYSAIKDIKSDLEDKSILDFIIYNNGAKEFLESNKETLANEISKFQHEINENINPEVKEELSNSIQEQISDNQSYSIETIDKLNEIEKEIENSINDKSHESEMEISRL